MPKAEAGITAQAVALARSHKRTLSGLLLLGVLAAATVLGMRWLSDPYRFPLGVVEVKGDLIWSQILAR